jgi:hypothetical protein
VISADSNRNGEMNSLSSALRALENEVRAAFPADRTGGVEVEVEVGVVARIAGDDVVWELAPAGTPAPHRVRFTVSAGSAASGGSAGHGVAPRGISDTEIIDLDPDLDLPPITRPRPGIQDDDHDR